MQVTLSQIAEKTGMSLKTVSDILKPNSKNRGRYSEATRDKVDAAAAEMNYLPNHAAKITATGRLSNVVLALSTVPWKNATPTMALNGIHDELIRNDYNLTLARFPDEELTDERFTPKFLRERMADGVIIAYADRIPQAMLELVERYQIPSIWMNSKQSADCVYPDDFGAGKRLAEKLIAKGHTRIAYHDYTTSTHYSTQDRRMGYVAAMEEAGLEPQLECAESVDLRVPGDARADYTEALLRRDDRPTAIICYGGELGPLTVGAARVGLRIPDDLNLATFAEKDQNDFGIPLETLVIPQREMGVNAVRMLLEKVSAPERRLAPKCIPFTEPV